MVEIIWKDDCAVLTGEQMDPALIFNCGQAFRFEREETGAYRGIAYGKQIWCRKTPNGMELFPVTPEEMEAIWKGYFDLDFCYPPEDARFSSDAVLREAAHAAPGFEFCARSLLRRSLPSSYPPITTLHAFGALLRNYASWQASRLRRTALLFPRRRLWLGRARRRCGHAAQGIGRGMCWRRRAKWQRDMIWSGFTGWTMPRLGLSFAN